MKTGSEADATPDARLQQVRVRLRAFSPVEFDLVDNLVVLDLDELILRVTFAMHISQYGEGLVAAVVIYQPTGTLREEEQADSENERRNELQRPRNAE